MTTKQIQNSTQNIKQYTNITDAIIEFDATIRNNGEKHFRIMRIYKLYDIINKNQITII